MLPNGTNVITHAFGGNFTIGNARNVNAIYVNVNAIYVYNIPSFAAQMIDTSIDGSANGTAGRFRNYPSDDWPTTPNTLVNATYFLTNNLDKL